VVKSSDGNTVVSQIVVVDNVTNNLRKLYVKAYLGVTANKAPKYWLTFQASVPPMGWNSYFILKSTGSGEWLHLNTYFHQTTSPWENTIVLYANNLISFFFKHETALSIESYDITE
jgi:alpha-mannosidase